MGRSVRGLFISMTLGALCWPEHTLVQMNGDTWDEPCPSRFHGKAMGFHCSSFQYTKKADFAPFSDVVLGLTLSTLSEVTVTA